MRWNPFFSRRQSRTRLYQITRPYTFESSVSRLMVKNTNNCNFNRSHGAFAVPQSLPATTAIMDLLSLRIPVPTPNHLRRTAWNDRQFYTHKSYVLESSNKIAILWTRLAKLKTLRIVMYEARMYTTVQS